MNIIELIKRRKSVRTFMGEPLSSEDVHQIEKYIAQLQPPFGEKVTIRLVHARQDTESVKLGTYGVIKKAHDFLVMVRDDAPLADVSAGYMFEQVILYCTELNLGTCWLGGTFNRRDFREQIPVQDNQKMTIISPVGYPAPQRSFLDSMMRAGAKSDSRKPFEELFFDQKFGNPLKKSQVGQYEIPLEMVRLAPSAANRQPWRVVMTNDHQFHFYHKKGHFSENDLGIALCHFEQTCKELQIPGNLVVKKDPVLHDAKFEYVISWLSE